VNDKNTDVVNIELIEMKPRAWVRFRCCWARRRAGPNLPAPALPSPSSSPITTYSSSGNAFSRNSLLIGVPEEILKPRYPFFDVYKTKEEATAALEERKRAQGSFPESKMIRIMKQKKEL
jgi:hypothetical protein